MYGGWCHIKQRQRMEGFVNETPFENVYIQPAAGDAGGALGAALYVYHVLLGNPKKFVLDNAYWGAEYSSNEIEKFLKENNHKYEAFDDNNRLVERIVDAILEQKVVALFQGRFEWGPRALGNRSILADPRRTEMKNIVNTKIKFREPFRPFAPVILEDCASDYFDIKDPTDFISCQVHALSS